MNSKKSIFKCVIIGCGNIASGYDFPDSDNILTHAHAYFRHPQTQISGFVDTDISKAKSASEIWGGNHYSDLEECLESEKPDIISICTPTETHFDVLNRIIDYKPQFIFLEKPVCSELEQSEKILNRLKEFSIPINVNFIRRFDTKLEQIRENYHSGKFGKYINGTAFYGKGISNNGSHCIDFLLWFFGIKSFVNTQKTIDFRQSDPSFGVCFELNNGNFFHLVPANENFYSIIEFDILFEKVRIKLKQFGLQISMQEVRKDPVFPGYYDLDEEKMESSNLSKSLYYSVDNIVKHLLSGEEIISPFVNGYQVQYICNQILKSPLLIKQDINFEVEEM